ncbi:hypothetical protein A5784_17690 [Mycobacterium sp. 852013-50091_SCH5140682]|uniref:DUF732 domain-containing protein n=1 Tax=Mycobacterium sp. 852013-50091_SCH5140682 TaxID=1834109 RepID=UPI0007EB8759|nr:DUF732 domain-containing protein [Mycobacterium sp. 852013-50091_SCH5140682]OBC01558.1 hypothetical protein A5784_17690 [Mycobacterium sp. 852013-50091_SCH5140682]
MNCPFCGAEVDRSGTCDRCGRVQESTSPTGWRPDPTARHEGRYYAAGHPTNRVRDGRAQSSDPDGGRMLPDYVELPASRSSIRSTWLGTGAATVILVMVAVVAWVLLMAARRPAPPPESGYLSALKEAGLSNQFNSDANAVAHGHQVCRQLDDGGPQQGLPADKIAVDSFCPQFTQGFHTLDTATVAGIFVVTDSAGVDAIASDGASCQGANGYSDVGRDTQVTVKNGKGEILATTALGQGKGNSANCTFSFSFPVTEGQDRYVVSVGHRGEFSYSFGQLRAQGVQIHLGH